MSSLYQFERRLFSRPRDTRAHKISSLCLRWESVQIPSAPLRSLYSPKGIHKGRKSKCTRGEYAPVPRLAPQKPVEGPHWSAAQSDALLGQQIGLSHEQREVTTCTNTPSGLPGVNPWPPSYGCVPKRKEGSERVTLSGRISHLGSQAGHNLAEVLGTSVQSRVICFYGGDAHWPPPANAKRAASQATDNLCPDLSEPGDRGQVEMVGRPFLCPGPMMTIVKYASMEGWGVTWATGWSPESGRLLGPSAISAG